MNVGKRKEQEKLFENFAMDEGAKFSVSPEVFEGRCSIIFAQPEALLSAEGRKLMCSKVFQDNVAACVIDEAHCVELWNGSRCTICKERHQHNSTTQYRSLYARNGKSRLNR